MSHALGQEPRASSDSPEPSGPATRSACEPCRSLCGRLWGIVTSTDHKVIACQYFAVGLLMAALGGYMAYVFRMQLAFPGESVPGFGHVLPGAYNSLVTNHGTIMIFWVAMPILIAGFGNYLIPLMIGCDDMVFPRLNRLSFHIFFLSAVVLLVSLHVPGGGFGGAWTAYPPLSSDPAYNLTPLGSVLWVVAVALEIVAFLIGGINFVTTVMNARAPGMTLMRIPLVIWMIVIASILFMLSVGPLVAGALMLLSDQLAGSAFYDPRNGGDPLLWQHLFWFFGHPEVYVVLLPAMGVVAEILTVFARKTFFGYKSALYVTIGTGVLSFFVWAHHQFVAGIDPRMAQLFTITTLLISIPIAELCFLFIATLYGGRIELKTPMLWAVAFLAEFLLGGVTGIYLGASGTDIHFHDTYFVVAHFHYTFFPIAIIGMFAGIYHWFPKVTGRLLDEKLGKIHFWGTIVSFNFVFIPLFLLGAAGQHRRIFDYRHFPELRGEELQDLRVLATRALIVLLLFQIPFLINLVRSYTRGNRAGGNPWRATTLEWAASSPPPHGNWGEVPPTVYRGPYEYAPPDHHEDFLPQHVEPKAENS